MSPMLINCIKIITLTSRNTSGLLYVCAGIAGSITGKAVYDRRPCISTSVQICYFVLKSQPKYDLLLITLSIEDNIIQISYYFVLTLHALNTHFHSVCMVNVDIQSH